MRIDSIELSWFRGAALNAEIPAGGKSCVVYGDNGSGKSSFVDGFEYLLCNGKIAHLSVEYADTKQKNCVRNTVTPDDIVSQTIVRFVGGNEVSCKIPNDGSVRFSSTPAPFKQELQTWKRESHILRQDEVAEFVKQTKSQKYKSLRVLLGLQKYEDVYNNFDGLEKFLLEKSNLEALKQKRGWIKEELDKNVKLYTKTDVVQALQEKTSQYNIEYKNIVASASESSEKVSKMIEDIEPGILLHNSLKKIRENKLIEEIRKFLEVKTKAKERLDELTENRLRLLEQAQEYIESHKEVEISVCPVCGAPVDKDKLSTHLEEELEILKDFKESSEKIRAQKRNVARTIEELNSIARDRVLIDWLEDNKDIKQLILEITSFELNIDFGWDIESIRTLSKIKNELNSCLEPYVKEEPPKTAALQTDLLFFNSAYRIIEYESLIDHIKKIEKLQEILQIVKSNIRKKINAITEITLEKITKEIQALWVIIHEDEPIEEIKLVKSDRDQALDIHLKFYGKDQESPILHLSEGYRNSLGLCVFLALAKQEPVDHPLILDDIVSSLDRAHRAFIVDVLKTELADRQVFILTHDTEWFNELNIRLEHKYWNFFKLRKWESPETGIIVDKAKFDWDEIITFLPEDTNAAGNATRTVMHHELDKIAELLKVRHPFVRGSKNEEIGPVKHMEAIIAQSQNKYRINIDGKWQSYTDPLDTWTDAYQLLNSWSNRGSHTGTITDREVERMVKRCQESLEYFICPTCCKPVWMLDKGTDYKRCDCGKLRWKL